MKIQVRFFAITREKAKTDVDTFELPPGSTVGALWDAIADRHAALAPLRRHLRLAVNLEYAGNDAPLTDGDEVALIPPVAGGVDLCTLTDSPIDPNAIIAKVRRPEAGAVVTFEGVVRNHAQGKDVARLEYEVYPAMALAKLREVAESVVAEHDGCMIAVEHRYGTLEVGESAVVIAVSSAHRGEAFTACQKTIDRIKEVVPIWKKEYSADGASWVGFGS